MEHFKRAMREKETKVETKLVGAEIPTDTFYYLTLFCVVDSCSKSSIIRPLVEKWAKKAKNNFTESELLKLAADKGYDSYKNRKNKKKPFAAIIQVQKRELLKKGVSEKNVDKIIKLIEDAKSKEN